MEKDSSFLRKLVNYGQKSLIRLAPGVASGGGGGLMTSETGCGWRPRPEERRRAVNREQPPSFLILKQNFKERQIEM